MYIYISLTVFAKIRKTLALQAKMNKNGDPEV